jgi:hypothetical protein
VRALARVSVRFESIPSTPFSADGICIDSIILKGVHIDQVTVLDSRRRWCVSASIASNRTHGTPTQARGVRRGDHLWRRGEGELRPLDDVHVGIIQLMLRRLGRAYSLRVHARSKEARNRSIFNLKRHLVRWRKQAWAGEDSANFAQMRAIYRTRPHHVIKVPSEEEDGDYRQEHSREELGQEDALPREVDRILLAYAVAVRVRDGVGLCRRNRAAPAE